MAKTLASKEAMVLCQTAKRRSESIDLYSGRNALRKHATRGKSVDRWKLLLGGGAVVSTGCSHGGTRWAE